MVREDILGGLQAALARGQTLKQAIMSFSNAGYLKEEIEEAANALQTGIQQPAQSQVPVKETEVFQRSGSSSSSQPEQKAVQQPSQPVQPQTIQKVSAYGQQAQFQPVQVIQPQMIQQPIQTIQRVSAYGQPIQPVQQMPLSAKPKGKAIIYILVALLIILIIGLIGVFFFKNEILSLLSS